MGKKIDTNTGGIYIHGVAITPTMRKIKDHQEYTAQDIVSIITTGKGQAVITFLEPVESNGVKAKVKVFIDEALQYFSIHITPRNVDDFLRGSKLWLEGMIDGYMADDFDSPISLSYPW